MKQQNATEMANPKQKGSKSQPSKRKAFEITQKYFAVIGITPSLVDKSYPFNGSILGGFIILGSGFYLTFAFLICDAETFAEYTQTACACSLEILITFTLLIVVLKVKKLFKLTNGADILVNTSKLLS